MMKKYSYKNSVAKSLVVAFGTWVIRSLILFLISWGVGCLFGASDIWSAILGAIIPVSVLGMLLSIILDPPAYACKEDKDLSASIFFFCFGWVVTSVALLGGVDLFCHLERLPVLFVVLFSGTILFLFGASIYYTYDNV